MQPDLVKAQINYSKATFLERLRIRIFGDLVRDLRPTGRLAVLKFWRGKFYLIGFKSAGHG